MATTERETFPAGDREDSFEFTLHYHQTHSYMILSYNLRHDRLRLASMAIPPAWRGIGHGTTMLRQAIDMARDAGFTELWLEVRRDNKHAIHLYKSAGFTRRRTIADFYADGCAAWAMRLSLVGSR